jgi:hypothetical protein
VKHGYADQHTTSMVNGVAERYGVLVVFHPRPHPVGMPDPDKLTPADPSDLASALAFALRCQGRKRVHNADEIMAEIVARRLVEPTGPRYRSLEPRWNLTSISRPVGASFFTPIR